MYILHNCTLCNPYCKSKMCNKLSIYLMLMCSSFFTVYRLIFFFYSFSRNEDSDINRSKLLLNGFIGQTTSNKYEDFTESFWGPRNNVENQTRQHYLGRNRYITEQSLRLPYPSVYGTQNISKYFTISTCYNK